MKLISGNLRYSSWSARAWTAMKLGGLPCDIEVLPLFEPATNAYLAAHAPNKKTPLLIDAELHIWDSLSILEYLAERAPNIWPQEAKARAVARSVCAEMHSSFQALRQHCTMNTGRHYPGFAMSDEALADVKRIESLWADCRARFGMSGDFLFGNFSGADCFYAPIVSRFITYDVALDADAAAYVAAVKTHPIIKAWFAQAAAEPWIVEKYEL
jgi:glutathione S-transferase